MHDLIEITLNIRIHYLSSHLLCFRDYSQFNIDHFHNFLAALDRSSLYSSLSINKRISLFNLYLMNTHDLYTSLLSIRAKRRSASWLNANIRLLMRRRNAARKTYRFCPSPSCCLTLCALHNQMKELIDNAKSYYLLIRIGFITGSAHLWSELRLLGLAKPKSSTLSNDFFLISCTVSSPLSTFQPLSLLLFYLAPYPSFLLPPLLLIHFPFTFSYNSWCS